jgi:NDP-sugar pyrophosphorylase family protein
MKAIIMAGGQGSRQRSLTSDQPKPMIRIANLCRACSTRV